MLLFFALLPTRGNAQTTVKEYRTAKASSSIAEIIKLKWYIGGLGEGIFWANAELTKQHAPLFCEPEKLRLVADNYMDIIDGQITRLSQPHGATIAEIDSFATGLLLLKGLEETFPCKSK